MNTQKYGPFFYTADDIKEILAYAEARHIQVVPEIELPGHARAALGAYPEFSCFPERIPAGSAAEDWGIFRDVFCMGNDETIHFLEDVLDYVCELFPSPIIHIGGDECPTINWSKCPKCQERMKKEGLTKPSELQVWITKHMAEHLAKKGRRIMGWDEILNGDVPKTAIGQSWRVAAKEGAGTDHVSGAQGAIKGHEMVMSPHNLTYYSYQQGFEEDPFRRAPKGGLSLETAYTFDPPSGAHRRVVFRWRRRTPSIRWRACRKRCAGRCWAGSAACGASISGTSTIWRGGCGRARSRCRRFSGARRRSATSRRSRAGPPSGATASLTWV